MCEEEEKSKQWGWNSAALLLLEVLLQLRGDNDINVGTNQPTNKQTKNTRETEFFQLKSYS